MIILSKTGYDHLDMGVNRQDAAFVTGDGRLAFSHASKAEQDSVLSHITNPIKFVLDGCGSTPHAEVGTALFAQYFSTYSANVNPDNFEEIADLVMRILSNDIIPSDRFRRDNLSFTILACLETEEDFVVKSCGDGFIIAIKRDGVLAITQLDDAITVDGAEYPNYLVYNHIDNRESLLESHRQAIGFTTTIFPKTEYARVGVATDGFRFVTKLDHLESSRWNEALLADKGRKLSMIVNRNYPYFHDDISICL